MSKEKRKKRDEPGFGETLRRDITNADLHRDVKSDYLEMMEFFLTDDRKEELKTMNVVKKVFVIPFWLLKALFLKLTPARRLLFVLGILLVLLSRSSGAGNTNNFEIIGAMVLIFIILMELKDKLMARNELEAGRAVQEALTPEPTPVFPGWEIFIYTRPANDVGGDLVDYLALEDGKMIVSLGDVAGKGLPAALFMAKLQATIRAIAPSTASVAEVGSKLNEISHRDGLPNRFASLVCLQIDSSSDSVKLLNAGHMPPIAVRGEDLTELPHGGPALGIIKNSEYTEQQVELKCDELLVVYSDGVTEARDEAGQFFGEERLRRLLKKTTGFPAKRIGDYLLQNINRFTSGSKPTDDLSLLILKRIPTTNETAASS